MDNDDLKKVLLKFPNMQSLVDRKETTLNRYYECVNKHISFCPSEYHELLFNAVYKYVCRTSFITPKEKEVLKKEFFKKGLVSTAEHHASISHPETLNLILNQLLCAESDGRKNIICLSCSTTKMDNELFPRGVFIEENKIPFLSNKFNKFFVSNTSKINEEIFWKNWKQFSDNKLLHSAQEYNRQKIVEFMKQFFKSSSCLESYSEQISLLNYMLYKTFFLDVAAGTSYFMVPAEEIITQVMEYERSLSHKTWLYRAIFSTKRERIYNVLDGARIFWDSSKEKGTFLFWDISSDRPKSLFLKDGQLLSKDGKMSFNFTEEEIFDKLRSREIIPSSGLVFLYLFSVFHLNLFGGILQVNYLEELKERLVRNHKELGVDDISKVIDLPTNLYVNFQKNKISSGGLLLIDKPINIDDYTEYKQYGFVEQMDECLNFLKLLL